MNTLQSSRVYYLHVGEKSKTKTKRVKIDIATRLPIHS